MARKRFTPEERALIAPGTLVEWHNGGGHWHPGIILSGVLKDEYGLGQYARMRNLGTTQRISPGNHYRATPEKVRAAGAATLAAYPNSRVLREMAERY